MMVDIRFQAISLFDPVSNMDNADVFFSPATVLRSLTQMRQCWE